MAVPTNGSGAVRDRAVTARLGVPFLGLLSALQTVDPSVASTALIGASRGLHLGSDQVALAASMMTMAVAASVISTGLVADRIGRRRMLVIALLVTVAGELVVVTAPGYLMYLTGRAVVGVGLGAVYGAAFAYIRAITPPGRLPGAVALFAATGGLALMVLTYLGGLVTAVDWRLAFAYSCVLSLLCIPLVLWILPPVPRLSGTSADAAGQVLLALGVVGVLWGLSRLSHGWDPLTMGPLVVGLLLLGLFYWYENRNENRFFPVSILRTPKYRAAICAGTVYQFGMAVSFLQLTNLWQYVTRIPVAEVALWQIPLSITGIATALVLGRFMLKGLSNASVLLGGGIVTVVGFVALVPARDATELWAFLPGMLLIGAGLLAASLPYGNLIIADAPPEFFGPVTSSRTTIGQFAYSAGFALSTVLVTGLTMRGTVEAMQAEAMSADQIRQGLDAVNAYAMSGAVADDSVGRGALAVAGAEYSTAFGVVMTVTAALLLAVTILGWWFIRHDAAAPVTSSPEPAAEGAST